MSSTAEACPCHDTDRDAVDAARCLASDIQAQIDAGDIEAARERAALEVARASGEAQAFLQHAHAVALNVNGRSVEALRAAGASRRGFQAAGNRSGELDALIAIASVSRSAGDHASAIETLEDAEVIARALDDGPRIGIVLRHIGICCSLLGRHHQGLSYLTEAAERHADKPGGRDHLQTLLSLYNGNLRRVLTLPPESRERIAELDLHLDLLLKLAADAAAAGATRIELMALGNHAITLHDLGRHRLALVGLEALMPRYRDHGMAPNEAICHCEMAKAHEAMGAHAAARSNYLAAIERFTRNGASGELREALEGLANVDEAMGDYRGARRKGAASMKPALRGMRQTGALAQLGTAMARSLLPATLLLALNLAACSRKEELIEPAPVAELQGPWLMVNRSFSCEGNYAEFGSNGFYRVYDDAPPKRYFVIAKFLVGPGKATMVSTGLGRDPDEPLNLSFEIAGPSIKLAEITNAKGESFSMPAQTLDAADQAYRRDLFRIEQLRFELKRCPGA